MPATINAPPEVSLTWQREGVEVTRDQSFFPNGVAYA